MSKLNSVDIAALCGISQTKQSIASFSNTTNGHITVVAIEHATELKRDICKTNIQYPSQRQDTI